MIMKGYLKVTDGVYIREDSLRLEGVLKFIRQYISNDPKITERLNSLRFLSNLTS